MFELQPITVHSCNWVEACKFPLKSQMTSLDLLYLPNTTHRWPSQSFHKTSLGLLNVNPGPLSRPVFQHHRDTYLGLSGPMWHSQLLQKKSAISRRSYEALQDYFKKGKQMSWIPGWNFRGIMDRKLRSLQKKTQSNQEWQKIKAIVEVTNASAAASFEGHDFDSDKTCVSGLRSVRELTAPGLKTTSPARRKVLVAPMQKLWVGVFSCLLHFQAPTQVIDLSVKWPSGSVIAS